MYSIDFPRMFKSQRTAVLKDHDAIRSNLQLLLASDKYALYGDPYYGTQLKTIIYEQNNQIVKDIVIDEIYSSIIQFMPQLSLQRSDITLASDGVDLFALIKCTYYLDQVSDLYEISLTSTGTTDA